MQPERLQHRSPPDPPTTPARCGDTPDQCRGRGITLSGADPRTMTAQQRRHEVAAILAIGILRRPAHAALPAVPDPSPASEQHPESGQDRLEVAGPTVLSGPTG
jgi:hypothetical protein